MQIRGLKDMKQYKKLFKMQYMYYLVCGIYVIAVVIFILDKYQNFEVNSITDLYHRSVDWDFITKSQLEADIKNDLVNESMYNICRVNLWIVIGIFVINIIKSITKSNRKTIEFMATLPITRIENTIFDFTMDSIFVTIVCLSIYLYERVYIFKHEIYNNCSEEIVAILGKLIIIFIASDIFIISIIKLLDVVTSNGVLACLIAVFNYFSLNFISTNVLQMSNKYIYNSVIRLFFPLNEYNCIYDTAYVSYAVQTNEFLKIAATSIAVAIILFIIALYYSKKIDYSRSGLFYFNLPRYINLGIISIFMVMYLVLMFLSGYYSIFIRVILVAVCIIAILLINHYIAPKKIKSNIA